METKQEQSIYHLSEQLGTGQGEGTINWKKKYSLKKTGTVNKMKAILES